MKLYIFSSIGDRVSREEVEVIEKNKIFVQKSGLSEKHYSKDMLDMPEKHISSISMISTSGKIGNFVEKVIELRKKEVDSLEKKIAAVRNDIIKLKMSYVGVLENRVEGDTYNAVSTLVFEHNEERVTATQESIDNRTPAKVHIHNVVTGEEFLDLMEASHVTKVFNIFMNGNVTNFAIEGFENNIENECVISISKFKEICNKTKVEIDYK